MKDERPLDYQKCLKLWKMKKKEKRNALDIHIFSSSLITRTNLVSTPEM